MRDKVIVTIRLESGGFEEDFEIPSKAKMQDVIPKLKNQLTQISPRIFPGNTEIVLFANGVELKAKDSLASRDLWDGSIIIVRRI